MPLNVNAKNANLLIRAKRYKKPSCADHFLEFDNRIITIQITKDVKQ